MEIPQADCYRYRRFKPGTEDIRLLEIDNAVGDSDGTIIGRLRHFKVDKMDDTFTDGARKKTYETLSYAWGPTYDDGSYLSNMIICDGQPLRITAHLNQGLKKYRARTQNERRNNLLWVDAICIDQSNLSEKNAHVQAVAHPQERNVWRDILDFSWFSRRWVLQEFALSINAVFMLGKMTIKASTFLACMRLAGSQDEYDGLLRLRQPAVPGVPTTTEAAAGMGTTLLQRLQQFRRTKYSHELDCVYALHSISKDRFSITVDYNLSMRELNEEIATMYFRSLSTTLALFNCATMWRNETYPSWLPDCSQSAITERDGVKDSNGQYQGYTFGSSQEFNDLSALSLKERTRADYESSGQAPEMQGNQLKLRTFVIRQVSCHDPPRYTALDHICQSWVVLGPQEGHALSGIHIDIAVGWEGARRLGRQSFGFASQDAVTAMDDAVTIRTFCTLGRSPYVLVLDAVEREGSKQAYRVVTLTRNFDIPTKWWKHFMRKQYEETIVHLE